MKGLLESPEIAILAREESVRGVLTRMALAEAAQADSRQAQLLEKALHLLLTRFQAMEGDVP